MNSQLNETAAISPPINPDERLGRRVKDKVGKNPRNLKRISSRIRENIPLPYQEFKAPSKSPLEISVDRLDKAPTLQVMGDISARNAITEHKIFQGWLTIKAKIVSSLGFRTEPCPDHKSRPPNPYHANIMLTEEQQKAKRNGTSYAHMLAANAKWLPYPE